MKQAAGETQVETGELSWAVGDVIRRAIAYQKEKRPASPLAFVNELRASVDVRSQK
jgi:hypothetical protein